MPPSLTAPLSSCERLVMELTRAGALPTALSTFLGRQTELHEVRGALAANRQGTITGMGASVRRVSHSSWPAAREAEYPNGIWLVELARTVSADLVADAVRAPKIPGRSPLDMAAEILAAGRHLLGFAAVRRSR